MTPTLMDPPTPTSLVTVNLADAASLSRSAEYCREIARTQARNFYHGMKLTPQPLRSAMYAVYAWMRAADDLADDDGTIDAKRARLGRFKTMTDLALDPRVTELPDVDVAQAPIWPAVARAFRLHHIAQRDLHDMVDGQLQDQHQLRYDTFGQLHDYCYKVASTVGLVCLSVWGLETGVDQAGKARARELAVHRGVALQLTNIIRDIVEDAQRGRVYLPAEDLARFNFGGTDTFRASVLNWHRLARDGQTAPIDARERGDVEALLRFQIERAIGYYEASSGLEVMVERDSRAACWVIMRVYRALLDHVAADPLAVLRGRVRLSKFQKISIGLRAMMGRSF